MGAGSTSLPASWENPDVFLNPGLVPGFFFGGEAALGLSAPRPEKHDLDVAARLEAEDEEIDRQE